MVPIPTTKEEFNKMGFQWKSKVKEELLIRIYPLVTRIKPDELAPYVRRHIPNNTLTQFLRQCNTGTVSDTTVTGNILNCLESSLVKKSPWWECLEDFFYEQGYNHLYEDMNPWNKNNSLPTATTMTTITPPPIASDVLAPVSPPVIPDTSSLRPGSHTTSGGLQQNDVDEPPLLGGLPSSLCACGQDQNVNDHTICTAQNASNSVGKIISEKMESRKNNENKKANDGKKSNMHKVDVNEDKVTDLSGKKSDEDKYLSQETSLEHVSSNPLQEQQQVPQHHQQNLTATAEYRNQSQLWLATEAQVTGVGVEETCGPASGASLFTQRASGLSFSAQPEPWDDRAHETGVKQFNSSGSPVALDGQIYETGVKQFKTYGSPEAFDDQTHDIQFDEPKIALCNAARQLKTRGERAASQEISGAFVEERGGQISGVLVATRKDSDLNSSRQPEPWDDQAHATELKQLDTSGSIEPWDDQAHETELKQLDTAGSIEPWDDQAHATELKQLDTSGSIEPWDDQSHVTELKQLDTSGSTEHWDDQAHATEFKQLDTSGSTEHWDDQAHDTELKQILTFRSPDDQPQETGVSETLDDRPLEIPPCHFNAVDQQSSWDNTGIHLNTLEPREKTQTKHNTPRQPNADETEARGTRRRKATGRRNSKVSQTSPRPPRRRPRYVAQPGSILGKIVQEIFRLLHKAPLTLNIGHLNHLSIG